MKNSNKNKVRNTLFNNFKYIKIGNFLKINVLIVPIIYAAIRFDYLNLILAAYITALMHEFFHIAAMKILKVPVKEIIIQPFGICAVMKAASAENSKKELAIALAGPFFNFSAVLFFLMFKSIISYEKYEFFILLNLAMGIFNLIPALPLDGGRALKAIISLNSGVIRAYNFMIALSRIIIFALLFLSAAALILSPFNFQLILTGVFLLCSLSFEQETLSRIILSDILNKKSSANQNSPLPVKCIAASKNAPARQILKFLSFDYLLEITVTGENGELVAHATESEIINLLMNRGIRSKFGDIVF